MSESKKHFMPVDTICEVYRYTDVKADEGRIMSIQQALEQKGISKEEFETVLKIRKITKKGNSAEVKRKTDGGLTVYEVRKEKR